MHMGDLVYHTQWKEVGIVVQAKTPTRPKSIVRGTLSVWFPQRGKAIWCLDNSVTLLSQGGSHES